ncbi:putative clathrin assembly protein [Cinnamomum micranthum f. kanehirae]|uniref:Putative clathrin assembly protein n=1 Tax=Cinnamomum micranthum f. kanehirae TaxID=337451 RepID=A0A3S3MX64_9MAGN|nr:putative clathrin assembly protein [Cinnamomum micranthum f. kanehirae]
MAPSKIHRALGRVKDQTSIGLAMVMSSSNSISALDSRPQDMRRSPIREASEGDHKTSPVTPRAHVSACVNTLSAPEKDAQLDRRRQNPYGDPPAFLYRGATPL